MEAYAPQFDQNVYEENRTNWQEFTVRGGRVVSCTGYR